MATRDNGETWALWRFLDLMLDASAVIHDYDSEVASFAMLAALAVADRPALSDVIVYRMRDSAIAEHRRRGRRDSKP